MNRIQQGVVGLLFSSLLGCGSEVEPVEETDAVTEGAVFGTQADLQKAESLWSALEGHEQWPQPAGMEGVVEGGSPHGAFIQYFLNNVAAQDVLADGSIVVKHNYTEADAESLDSITVVEKVTGYNSAEGDWFWVKFDPAGAVMTNPNGVALAGKVGSGGEMGCIPCHADAEGGDYLFMND